MHLESIPHLRRSLFLRPTPILPRDLLGEGCSDGLWTGGRRRWSHPRVVVGRRARPRLHSPRSSCIPPSKCTTGRRRRLLTGEGTSPAPGASENGRAEDEWGRVAVEVRVSQALSRSSSGFIPSARVCPSATCFYPFS